MYTFSIVGPIVNVYTSINRVRFEELCFDLFKGINTMNLYLIKDFSTIN